MSKDKYSDSHTIDVYGDSKNLDIITSGSNTPITIKAGELSDASSTINNTSDIHILAEDDIHIYCDDAMKFVSDGGILIQTNTASVAPSVMVSPSAIGSGDIKLGASEDILLQADGIFQVRSAGTTASELIYTGPATSAILNLYHNNTPASTTDIFQIFTGSTQQFAVNASGDVMASGDISGDKVTCDTLKMTTGAGTAGRVLVSSDIHGNAEWGSALSSGLLDWNPVEAANFHFKATASSGDVKLESVNSDIDIYGETWVNIDAGVRINIGAGDSFNSLTSNRTPIVNIDAGSFTTESSGGTEIRARNDIKFGAGDGYGRYFEAGYGGILDDVNFEMYGKSDRDTFSAAHMWIKSSAVDPVGADYVLTIANHASSNKVRVLRLAMGENPGEEEGSDYEDFFLRCVDDFTSRTDTMGGVRFWIDGTGAHSSTFTGQHWVVYRASSDENRLVDGSSQFMGMIVNATGEIWNERRVDEALPVVVLSDKNKLATVYGVLTLARKGYDLSYFQSFNGIFNDSCKPSENSDAKDNCSYSSDSLDYKAHVNSIGEGQVWVTNYGGEILNGDYITSSNIAGYGMKQDDDILHNYTVAKCVESIDWNSVTETVEYEGSVFKKYLTACTYHCG